MRLFVLRHGQAEPYRADDAGRELVATGRAEVSAVITASLASLQGVDEIWVSPLVRAQQTAQLALAQLGSPTLVTNELLVPEADPGLLINALQKASNKTLLLVSHQPFVGRLLDVLCASQPGNHAMATGALACVEYTFPAAGLGQLSWLRHASSL